MALTQAILREKLRGESFEDILMITPDKNIQTRIQNVVANTTLPYSSLNTIIDFNSYSHVKMATLERNLWLLDGTFFNPFANTFHPGYISNTMSDDNGDYATNPLITVSLLEAVKVEYLTLLFNSAIRTSYPKQVLIRTYNANNAIIKTHTYKISDIATMPTMIVEIGDDNVKSVQFEFVGTQAPHRRTRLSSIIFGRAEIINTAMLKKWEIADRASLVTDSIPSRLFSYTLVNYEGDYNIDNPNALTPMQDKNTMILFRIGMENQGFVEWGPMTNYRLSKVSTGEDDSVTFECGSVLDMMTTVFDQDIYNGERTVKNVVDRMLSYEGLPGNLVTYDSNYGSVKIDRPLPELQTREILQLCAFACGATLMILDDGTIRFADLNLTTVRQGFDITYDDSLEPPRAEQLLNTSNIALTMTRTTKLIEYEDEAKTKEKLVELGSMDVTTVTDTRISHAACFGSAAVDRDLLAEQGASLNSEQHFSTHSIVRINLPQGVESAKVSIIGTKVETKTTVGKTVTNNTLILDSQLMKYADNNVFTKYKNWYEKKFKYTLKTRGEPLIRATDIINIETPFTGLIKCYVLSNKMTDEGGGWDGEMEVIVLGNS